jgi:asparagine synthase (glutamine-hydrolysing)
MSFFACAIHTGGGRVPPSFRAGIDAAPFCRGKTIAWHGAHGFVAALDLDEGGLRPAVAHLGLAVGIGVVRLDNRAEVAKRIGLDGPAIGDLELAMRFALAHDGARMEHLLGDFAFVVWDPATRRLVAARDTFGFSSRAELLACGDRYDVQYLADRIAYCTPDPERTVYAGVSAVPPASVLTLRRGMLATTTYWSAREAQDAGACADSFGDQCDAFRALLMDAVRLRLTDTPETWSHLSGGLDSSSVVCVAERLARLGEVPNGLAGTVTYTDSLGTGADEKEYSDAVVAHCGVRNELVPHRVARADLMCDLPLLDQPNQPYSAAIRDRAAASVVRQAGGRVLLTGAGGDGLVMGTMFFFADWIVTGHAGRAIREMVHRAALGRVSFWELAYQNAMLPLMPLRLRHMFLRGAEGSVPPWVAPAIARRFELASRTPRGAAYGGRVGHKYSDAVAAAIGALPSAAPSGPFDDLLDVRHPYLHRPLARLALQLAPELCVRPHARKWVLRQAMRGIVPEVVRTRIGKGTADGLNAWSLAHEQRHVGRLLEDPVLAQLGCVDLPKLRTALEQVRRGQTGLATGHDRVSGTIEVEMWLQLRSGRWAAADSQVSNTDQHEMA